MNISVFTSSNKNNSDLGHIAYEIDIENKRMSKGL